MTANTINSDETLSGDGATVLSGRYKIVHQLGQGGMGSVWLAEDLKLDGRRVAIKMLPSILVSNKRAYNQVKREALVSLKLSHPNIAAVRAFEEEQGNPFLVMDYIEGQTLDDMLGEEGRLSESATIRLLTPIADALDYAHKQGVVHRDVKPGNVMISTDGTPYILDFGIAREVQETMTRVTGAQSSGTLMYMSPEQLHGKEPTPAQDIYAFAAMVYECVSGRPPFSRGQIEYQIEHDIPEKLDPAIRLADVIQKGLAKTAEDRPTSCKALLDANYHSVGDTMKIDIGRGVSIEFCWCAPGVIDIQWMGDEGIEIRGVNLTKGYWIAKTPITVEQYAIVQQCDPTELSELSDEVRNLPVADVNWYECVEFCAKITAILGNLTCRLPTEAQWVNACRAGGADGSGHAACPWEDMPIHKMAWHNKNSDGRRHPVKGKLPNSWGIYDMHGNVAEWCQDWCSETSPMNRETDPNGPMSGTKKILRGGGYSSTDIQCFADLPEGEDPDSKYDDVGFRPVLI